MSQESCYDFFVQPRGGDPAQSHPGAEVFNRLKVLMNGTDRVSAAKEVVGELLDFLSELIGPDTTHDVRAAQGTKQSIPHKRSPFWPKTAQGKRPLLC
jgi:hypothetical protein